MPSKGGTTARKKELAPSFAAFGKLDRKGQISDKKGAAALAKASVRAGGVLLRLIPARAACLQHGFILQARWERGALDIQRMWRGHGKRGIARWDKGTIDIILVVLRKAPGHIRRVQDLQRVWRGHVQRRRVAYGDTPKWHLAATKLQRLYRGSVTRQLTKQLKFVRSVSAAFMLAAMAVEGDSAVLRREGAGKYREPAPLIPAKPQGSRPAGTRPSTMRPTTQSIVASMTHPPAGPVSADASEEQKVGVPGQQMEQEVARAIELSQMFLSLTPDQLDLVFNCMDASNHGHILRQEVVKAAQSAQLGKLCVDMFFVLADSNGDGVVDRKEFDDALIFVRHFFAGSLLNREGRSDQVSQIKIGILKAQLEGLNAEANALVGRLSQMKAAQRVPAIFALSKVDRIRVARMNREVLQDATVHMDRREEHFLRKELSEMGDEPDEAKEIQNKITQIEEEVMYNEYFILRSPCRQRLLSRAELAALEAERMAAEEAARLALLESPALLRITVVRARDIIAADRNFVAGSSSDPYVCMQIGHQLKKTKIKKKTLTPEWNETFELLLDPVHRRERLRIECFDYDLIGSDDFLGQITLDLDLLKHGQEYTQWHAFRSEQGADGKGEIELRYKLVLQSEEEAAEAARVAALIAAPAILEITIMRADDLLAADQGGTSDPYVHIQVGDAKKAAKKTTVKKKTLAPVWDQTFTIRLDGTQRRDNLTLECFDYDMLGSDDSLGKVEVPLETLVLAKEYVQWYNLQQRANGESKGRLQVSYKLIVGNQSHSPATLYLTVVRAQNLIAADRGGTSDPYVRLHIGQALKDAKKTKVRKKTLNPEYNHTFKFRLVGSQRQDDLAIECFDHDMVGADDSLGKVTIPIDALRSNEEYVQWHKLRQGNGSKGEIELRYTLVEKSDEQVRAEAETLRPGTLKLEVVRARDLIATDRGGMSDPYVRLHIGHAVKEAQETDIKKKTLSPEWNQTFEFELNRAQRQDYMTFECFDWDMIGADDSLGAFDLELDALVFDQECVEWFELVQEGEMQHQGEVQLRYTFVPGPVESSPDDETTETHPVLSLPDSMTLGPASLEVTVVGAKDLLAADRSGTSDPFVRLHVGNAVKEALKTKVLKKTLNPEWNQTFNLRIDSYKRRESLQIECFDYDLVGSNDSLGKANIGLGQLVPEHEYTQWCKLESNGIKKGQVQLRYKLVPLPDLESSASLPLPAETSRNPSTSLDKGKSFPLELVSMEQNAETATGSIFFLLLFLSDSLSL